MALKMREKRALTAFVVSSLILVPAFLIQGYINQEIINRDKTVTIEKTCYLNTSSIFGENNRSVTLRFNDNRELVNYQVMGALNFNNTIFDDLVHSYKNELISLGEKNIVIEKKQSSSSNLVYDFTIDEFTNQPPLSMLELDTTSILFNDMIASAVASDYNCENTQGRDIIMQKNNATPVGSEVPGAAFTINEVEIDLESNLVTIVTTGDHFTVVPNEKILVIFNENGLVVSYVDIANFSAPSLDNLNVLTTDIEPFEAEYVEYMILDKNLIR